MKDPNRAISYAMLYPGLCDISRSHGYALAMHGSLLDDLDLIAVPWSNAAADHEVMVSEIKDHLELCLETSIPDEHWKPEMKPHGRIAYKIFLQFGASVDLSVLKPALKGEQHG